MEFNIKYNEKLGEFTSELSLQMRIKNYIEHHFYPTFAIATMAPTFLVGGSIRDLILARTPKDMDFVVLGTENNDLILSALEKFNINYELNRFDGYKFIYNGTKIDL